MEVIAAWPMSLMLRIGVLTATLAMLRRYLGSGPGGVLPAAVSARVIRLGAARLEKRAALLGRALGDAAALAAIREDPDVLAASSAELLVRFSGAVREEDDAEDEEEGDEGWRKRFLGRGDDEDDVDEET